MRCLHSSTALSKPAHVTRDKGESRAAAGGPTRRVALTHLLLLRDAVQHDLVLHGGLDVALGAKIFRPIVREVVVGRGQVGVEDVEVLAGTGIGVSRGYKGRGMCACVQSVARTAGLLDAVPARQGGRACVSQAVKRVEAPRVPRNRSAHRIDVSWSAK